MNQPSLTYQEHLDEQLRVSRLESLWPLLGSFCFVVALYYSLRHPSLPSDLLEPQEPMPQSDSSTPSSEFSESSENSN